MPLTPVTALSPVAPATPQVAAVSGGGGTTVISKGPGLSVGLKQLIVSGAALLLFIVAVAHMTGQGDTSIVSHGKKFGGMVRRAAARRKEGKEKK